MAEVNVTRTDSTIELVRITAVGPQGIQGESGTSGINGTNGSGGINGTNGSGGVNGTSGINGTNGSGGTSGLRGDSLFALTGSVWATTNTIEITGSLTVSSSGTFTNIGPANFIGNQTISGSLNVSSSIISSDKVDAPNINVKGGNISFDANGAGILHTGQFNITTVFEDNALAKTWTFNQYGTLTTPGDIVVTGSLNVSSSIILANGARISDNVDNALAFGLGAGIEQQNGAIAIGDTAGLSQGYQAIAIGNEAAGQGGNQGQEAIAIGLAAGGSDQSLYAIAIGSGAGQISQSMDSVAIGHFAGRNSQTRQTIILNATGDVVDSIDGQSGSFYVAPIRKATGADGILQYNSSSREVTYSNSISGSISITGSLNVSGSSNLTGSVIINELTYPTSNFVDGQYGVEVPTLDTNNVFTMEVPKTIYEYVKNDSGTTLLKGTPVHSTGTVGFNTLVIAASASNASTMPATFILAQNLDDEEEGLGIAIGAIQGVNTTGLTAGDPVWVGASGGFTQTKPTGSNLIQNLGIITKVGANGGGVVLGAGRSNDVPNIQQGYIWVGNKDSVATAIPTSSILLANEPVSSSKLHISEFAKLTSVSTFPSGEAGMLVASSSYGFTNLYMYDGSDWRWLVTGSIA